MPTARRFIAQILLPPFLPLFSTAVLHLVLLLLILEMQGFKYILLVKSITRKDEYEGTISKSSYWKKMFSPIWVSKWRTVRCMNSCRRTREESMANYKQRGFSLVIIVIMSSWCLRLLSSVRACIYKLELGQNQTVLNVSSELLNTEKPPLMHIAMVCAALFFSQQGFNVFTKLLSMK